MKKQIRFVLFLSWFNITWFKKQKQNPLSTSEGCSLF